MKRNANQLNISENELLDYINQVADVHPKRPLGFGITAREYCASQNPVIAFTTGRRLLSRLVDIGKLKVQTMKENGHLVTVYFK